MKHLIVFATLATCAQGWAQPLSLADALAYGQKHNPVLRASEAAVAAARADANAAKGRLLPQLSASAWASQGDMPNMLRSAMGVDPASMVRAPQGEFFDANLMLMAPLHTGGWLSGKAAAASARERAARAETADARAEVSLRIREAYLRALVGADLVATQQARVRAAEAMVANARAQMEAGRGIEATVQRAEAELAEARRGETSAENARRKALLDLLETMGAPLDQSPELADALEGTRPRPTLEYSLAQADAARGELQAARRRLEAGRGDAESASGALHPQIYGFAMGDAFSPRDAMGRQAGVTFGVVVSVPIFDGGTRSAEAAGARSIVAQAQAEVDRVRLQVEKEVRQAWLDLETADRNLESAEAELAASQAAYDVIALRVQTGKGILVEQLDALTSLTRARSNRALALYDQGLALAHLDRAIGIAIPKESENR
ncbi:MAG: TolC family protein [Fimbriimonadaceae bacterium]|nr:TolC family protein [Fimbriimonadaceae bacterium]